MRCFDASEIRGTVRSAAAVLLVLVCAAGCHDGPMFALKRINPYYTQYQWAADEALGPSDATRQAELDRVVDSIGSMNAAEQRRWVGELAKLVEHDASAHMRGQAVRAAGRSTVPEALTVIEAGMQDDHFKVRMIACTALASRADAEATRLLAESVSSETHKDVRLAAIKSLGAHRGPQATDALKLALQEPDLAYRHASIASLRQVTGRDVGSEPEAWLALLESPQRTDGGEPTRTATWRERLGSFF